MAMGLWIYASTRAAMGHRPLPPPHIRWRSGGLQHQRWNMIRSAMPMDNVAYNDCMTAPPPSRSENHSLGRRLGGGGPHT